MSDNSNNKTKTKTTTMMKAVQIHKFIGDNDFEAVDSSFMTLDDAIEMPTPDANHLVVKVLACSLSPGDVLTARGSLIFLHPSSMPFIPGMDVCGRVVAVDGEENDKPTHDFKVGDVVVASNGMQSIGGLAEYMSVPLEECVLKPKAVSTAAAAASSSAITAWNAVQDYVNDGDRVLVLGGSGGVGSACIQLCKQHGKAAYIATTSTQTKHCKALGADAVLNYRNQDWWQESEYQKEKFDVIIDTVGGNDHWSKSHAVLKTRREGGRFVAVAGDDPKPDIQSWPAAIGFFAKLPLRPLYTLLFGWKVPAYTLLMPSNVTEGRRKALEQMADGKLQVLLDERSPHPFTLQGAQQAFAKVASGHAHGKVVVTME